MNPNVEHTKIIASNIKKFLQVHKMHQKELAKKVGISPSTLSDYLNLRAKPSHSVVQKIAEVFDVEKSDIDTTYKSEKTVEDRKERDIAKRVDQLRLDLETADALAFMGEPLSNEAKESLMSALEFVVRQTNEVNKKYIPKKHRDE